METKQTIAVAMIFLMAFFVPVTLAEENVDISYSYIEKGFKQIQDASAKIAVSYSSATVAGTTGNSCEWNDPQALERYPQKRINDYNCDKISNISIVGSVPTMIEAASEVTVNGYAVKKSSTCNGYAYLCRRSVCIECSVQDSMFKLCYQCKECPKGFTKQIECVNSKCITKTAAIIALVAAAAMMAIAIYAALPASTSMGLGGEVAMTETAEFYATAQGATAAAGTSASSGFLGISSTGLGKIGTATAGFGSTVASIAVTGPGKNECHSVCANEYWTDGYYNGYQGQCSAAPICSGNPIQYKECEYPCAESACGFYKGGLVIEIKDNDGNVVQTYLTRTDSKGKFSYTFTAPPDEGPYVAVITAAGAEE